MYKHIHKNSSSLFFMYFLQHLKEMRKNCMDYKSAGETAMCLYRDFVFREGEMAQQVKALTVKFVT